MLGSISDELGALLEPIRLLILDVDGVLTDGRLVYSATGEVVKQFCARDGLGIKLLLAGGIEVAVLTGRRSDMVTARCRELGMRGDLVLQGVADKAAGLDQLERLVQVEDHQVAAMGDDLPDLPLLVRAGFSACPAEAAPQVAERCRHRCSAAGGRGAVREVAELLLEAQGRWGELVSPWLDGGSPPSEGGAR
jgi:3-deoxy-D-manno-octulosonate 8-phosphate phosphatase (KDO 8-P phosphatase)